MIYSIDKSTKPPEIVRLGKISKRRRVLNSDHSARGPLPLRHCRNHSKRWQDCFWKQDLVWFLVIRLTHSHTYIPPKDTKREAAYLKSRCDFETDQHRLEDGRSFYFWKKNESAILHDESNPDQDQEQEQDNSCLLLHRSEHRGSFQRRRFCFGLCTSCCIFDGWNSKTMPAAAAADPSK